MASLERGSFAKNNPFLELRQGFLAVVGEELCCPAEIEILNAIASGRSIVIDLRKAMSSCVGFEYLGYNELVELADRGIVEKVYYVCLNSKLRKMLPRIAQPVFFDIDSIQTSRGTLKLSVNELKYAVSKHRADAAYLDASQYSRMVVLGLEKPWNIAAVMIVVARIYGAKVYLVSRKTELPEILFDEVIIEDPVDFLKALLYTISKPQDS